MAITSAVAAAAAVPAAEPTQVTNDGIYGGFESDSKGALHI